MNRLVSWNRSSSPSTAASVLGTSRESVIEAKSTKQAPSRSGRTGSGANGFQDGSAARPLLASRRDDGDHKRRTSCLSGRARQGGHQSSRALELRIFCGEGGTTSTIAGLLEAARHPFLMSDLRTRCAIAATVELGPSRTITRTTPASWPPVSPIASLLLSSRQSRNLR